MKVNPINHNYRYNTNFKAKFFVMGDDTALDYSVRAEFEELAKKIGSDSDEIYLHRSKLCSTHGKEESEIKSRIGRSLAMNDYLPESHKSRSPIEFLVPARFYRDYQVNTFFRQNEKLDYNFDFFTLYENYLGEEKEKLTKRLKIFFQTLSTKEKEEHLKDYYKYAQYGSKEAAAISLLNFYKSAKDDPENSRKLFAEVRNKTLKKIMNGYFFDRSFNVPDAETLYNKKLNNIADIEANNFEKLRPIILASSEEYKTRYPHPLNQEFSNLGEELLEFLKVEMPNLKTAKELALDYCRYLIIGNEKMALDTSTKFYELAKDNPSNSRVILADAKSKVREKFDEEIYNRFYRAEDDPRVVSFNRKMQHLIENFETENQEILKPVLSEYEDSFKSKYPYTHSLRKKLIDMGRITMDKVTHKLTKSEKTKELRGLVPKEFTKILRKSSQREFLKFCKKQLCVWR